MNQTDKDKILAAAKEKYNGDLDVAIAEHLMGEVVIIRSGGQVPAGADLATIAQIREELGGKTPAKTKTPAKPKAKTKQRSPKKSAGFRKRC